MWLYQKHPHMVDKLHRKLEEIKHIHSMIAWKLSRISTILTIQAFLMVLFSGSRWNCMPDVVRESFRYFGTQQCLCVPPDEAMFTDIIGYMHRCALGYWSYSVYRGRYHSRYVLNSPWCPLRLVLDRDIPVCINIESGLLQPI